MWLDELLLLLGFDLNRAVLSPMKFSLFSRSLLFEALGGCSVLLMLVLDFDDLFSGRGG